MSDIVGFLVSIGALLVGLFLGWLSRYGRIEDLRRKNVKNLLELRTEQVKHDESEVKLSQEISRKTQSSSYYKKEADLANATLKLIRKTLDRDQSPPGALANSPGILDGPALGEAMGDAVKQEYTLKPIPGGFKCPASAMDPEQRHLLPLRITPDHPWNDHKKPHTTLWLGVTHREIKLCGTKDIFHRVVSNRITDLMKAWEADRPGCKLSILTEDLGDVLIEAGKLYDDGG